MSNLVLGSAFIVFGVVVVGVSFVLLLSHRQGRGSGVTSKVAQKGRYVLLDGGGAFREATDDEWAARHYAFSVSEFTGFRSNKEKDLS